MEWPGKLEKSNFDASTNTIDTRSSVISQNGDFLTICNKHSIKNENFSEELKVNDKARTGLSQDEELKSVFFAFSHGYLNEMGINMMENLLNIAANNKIMNTKVHQESMATNESRTLVETNINKRVVTEHFIDNVYMEVEFYKWCKLLDWKLKYDDMRDVLQDLIKL